MKRKYNEITIDILKELLDYNSETGKLYWKKRDRKYFPSDRSCTWWNNRYSKKEAFAYKSKEGYYIGSIFGKTYLKHRVIWAFHYEKWPSDEIDHINRIRDDNRICNLRVATHQQNLQNKTSHKGSTSKYLGVYWHKQSEKWIAQIRVNGAKMYLGIFNNEENAAIAYDKASKKHHKEFANFNFPELVE